MKVAKLISMLEQHNLQADINFRVTGEVNVNRVAISTKASCKCKEEEIYLTIGQKGELK